MAKVTYLPGDTTQFGYAFEAGKPTEVTDAKHLAKFAGNPFFEVDDDPDCNPSPAAPEGPFVAKEKSAGWWAIYDGLGIAIGKAIRETDATAFNAFTEDEKATYVADLSK